MIAADTSSLIAFLHDEDAPDAAAIDSALRREELALPPVVLMEALSDPIGKKDTKGFLLELPMLEISAGYWRRAAEVRQTILKLKLKGKLADALVVQSCIDYDVALITRDKDFRHYAKHCGLKLHA